MIHALIGHSASGKSTIESKLETYKGIPRIVSYTTRPMRVGEEDGVNYHYVSEQEFALMEEDGLFSETATYREWHYGLKLPSKYQTEDYVAVVTPSGYRELVKAVGNKYITSYFISVPERERMARLVKRGDDVDEIIRRIHADRIDFDGFIEQADFIIVNEDVDKSVEMVYTIIKCLNK
jgi:guanylate kinase